MTETLLTGVLSALWLGILTSISPCPLASNIVAISFIGKNLGKTLNTLLAGLFYTIGRTVAYVVLAALIVASLLSTPAVAQFLQYYMNRIIGPLLVLVGIILLEVLKIPGMKGFAISDSLKKRIEESGIWGAGLLGIIFALTFCPVSAALFFGSLLPLSITHNSRVFLPVLYGVGTALPVIVFSFIIAFSAQSVGKAFNNLTVVEKWARRITGVVFIVAGIYMSAKHIAGLI